MPQDEAIGHREYPDMGMGAEVAHRFTYHPPQGPDQVKRYEMLRGRGRALAEDVLRLTPAGREQSLALTKIEEAVFWANAAIARGEAPE